MTDPRLASLVLAAGGGTRMRSFLPKPLHALCGRPMLLHVLDRIAELEPAQAVVVVGRGADQVVNRIRVDGPVDLRVDFAVQPAPMGTGDAVAVGLAAMRDEDDDLDLLVAHGDQPLVRSSTLAALVTHHRRSGAAATILSVRLPDPTGYGRVVRDRDGRVSAIVEHRDASMAELEIDETNTGFYCFKRGLLAPALRRLRPSNDQGEIYLTDVVEVLARAGHLVETLEADEPGDMLGINDRAQLAAAEAELRRRMNADWMRRGVTMLDPSSVYLDVTVTLGADVTLLPGTVLQGATSIGEGSTIGPATHLVDTTVGCGSVVHQTAADGAGIGDGAQVGPFASLGKGAMIADGVVTGPSYTAG